MKETKKKVKLQKLAKLNTIVRCGGESHLQRKSRKGRQEVLQDDIVLGLIS